MNEHAAPRTASIFFTVMSHQPSPRSIVAAFDRLEADLISFLGTVPYVPEHEAVWSPALVNCIFEACSQLDSLWKLRAGPSDDSKMPDYFARLRGTVATEWLVLWDGDGLEVAPFSPWSGQTEYVALPWWQSYNKLKHNRWENVTQATLSNAVNAAAALFLAIALDNECQAALAERKWLHSRWATEYMLEKLSKPEGILGVTVESQLFSYAFGSARPNFPGMLSFFHDCSRRFGKWMEAKYQCTFMF